MSRLYGKLAATNIRNSKQFYLPYLLTGMLSAAMFYLMLSMRSNPGLDSLGNKAADVRLILGFGVFVVGVFVSVFLFYTNSFIMKRRKKELGVYNILGMEKKHIARVLFLETLFTAVVSTGGGLATGIVFHKLMTMILYRLTSIAGSAPFFISWEGCRITMVLFGAIYGAALLYNLMQIKLANPVELLHSASTGEREPKTKLLMALLGVLTLGAGYVIALTTTDAVQATLLFFVAVLLVIAGTYLLFTAGSIAFLKLMRKNKNYYYRPKHFTTVSGMLYRMKQNAVGLANICILSTMVLVTVSTTVSLYIGREDRLKSQFPVEISASAYYHEMPENIEEVSTVIGDALKNAGRTITARQEYLIFSRTAVRRENEVSMPGIGEEGYDLMAATLLKIMPEADYETMTGQQIPELSAGEVAVAAYPEFAGSTLLLEGDEYAVRQICPFPEDTKGLESVMDGACYVIVPDEAAVVRIYEKVKSGWNGEGQSPQLRYDVLIDIDGTPDEKLAAEQAMRTAVEEWEAGVRSRTTAYDSVYLRTREGNRANFYQMYGALFFLGLFLGSLFLMVTVLIIFYKQISEGYEDKDRYGIMEKVGMSSAEVKSAIRSQVLTVFFLPIVAAVLHVTMAFPMIRRILLMFGLMNTGLFIAGVAGTALVFGIIYLLVFTLTSRSYYRIVGNQV